MAKKEQPTYPNPIYKDLDQTNINQKLKLCLVMGQGSDPKFHKYRQRTDCPAHDKDLKVCYIDWDAMEQDKSWDMPRLEEEHKKLFGHPIPPKMNRTDATVVIWLRWIQTAEDKTAITPTQSAQKGKRLASRKYYLKPTPANASLKTPQAVTCLNILKNAIGSSESVTEDELKKLVYERAAELKTKQDPWRIFQYYRPQLIANGFIRHD